MKVDTFEVLPEQEGERLDKYLSIIYPDVSRSFFQKIIKDNNVVVNSKAQKANYRNTLLPYKVFRLLFGVVFILYYLCIT